MHISNSTLQLFYNVLVWSFAAVPQGLYYSKKKKKKGESFVFYKSA